MERLEALEQKNAEYETSKLVSQKRSELLAKFKEKGINDSKWIDKYMNKLNLTKDSDIEHLCDAKQHIFTAGGVDLLGAVDIYHLAHAVDAPAVE